jgi:aryl-alcohol dehydrogenase-like predicted oxidoreductase
MKTRTFGSLWPVSALTLGGGGIGQVWGPTTRDEAIATTREAVEAGITMLDVAPLYGQGEAESVIGAAFGGKLPQGVRISTKCRLENIPASEIANALETSLRESFHRLRLEYVDVLFLHSQTIPNGAEDRYQGTPFGVFREAVVPAFLNLREQGLIGAWGMSAIGLPSVLIQAIEGDPAPQAVQAIANCLDSPGGLKRFDEPARPRDIISAAGRKGAAVMGIRAVQAGALTDALDRPLADDHPEVADFNRAAPFRAIAKGLGESAAALAHRYSLSMQGVDTVVLGVKNRQELREGVEAEARGPLGAELIQRIDQAVGR